MGDNLRLDLLVEKKVVVELKAVKEITGVFEAQLLTWATCKSIFDRTSFYFECMGDFVVLHAMLVHRIHTSKLSMRQKRLMPPPVEDGGWTAPLSSKKLVQTIGYERNVLLDKSVAHALAMRFK